MPIFQPQQNVNSIFRPNRSQRLWQAGGDALAGIGQALAQQGPSPYPISPFAAISQGLSQGQQMGRQRQQDYRQQAMDDLTMQQAQQQQAEFLMKQEETERQRKAQAQQAEYVESALKELPPEQQALARANPDAFLKHVMETKFAKPEGPSSGIAKIQDDLAKGFITPEQAQAAIKKETYIAPVKPDQGPADVQEYLYAKSQGFQGSFMDYKASQKGQGFSMTLPDGTSVQMGGAIKPPTGEQQTAANRAQLFKTGMDELTRLATDPNVGAWNMAGAETLEGLGPFGRVIGGKMRSGAEQQWAAAQASALEGLAASVTGAGVTQDQFARYTSMLPAATDEPETRKTKLKAANDFLTVTLTNAGAAGQALLKTMEGGRPLAPIIGTEVDGYRFKGGKPADPANWEKVAP